MAYYNGYPVTYQPMQFQPYQMQYQQPQQAQGSRMVEVYPAANEKAVQDFPSQNGSTTMFVAGDDSFIAVKEVSVTGQVSVTVYDKRPPAPPEKALDLTAYVTREELESRLAALAAPKRTNKEETEA